MRAWSHREGSEAAAQADVADASTSRAAADIESEVDRVFEEVLPAESSEDVAERLSQVRINNTQELEWLANALFHRIVADPSRCELYADMLEMLRSRLPEFPREPDEAGKDIALSRFILCNLQTVYEEQMALFEPEVEDRGTVFAPRPLDIKNLPAHEPTVAFQLQVAESTNNLYDWNFLTLGGQRQFSFKSPDQAMTLGDFRRRVRTAGLAKAPVVLSQMRGQRELGDDQCVLRGTDDIIVKLIPAVEKLLNLTLLVGHLFLRDYLAVKIIGQVMHDLIGMRDTLPEEHMIMCAHELLQIIGDSLDDTPHGEMLVQQFCIRLEDLGRLKSPDGKHVYSTWLRHQIDALAILRKQRWPLPRQSAAARAAAPPATKARRARRSRSH